MNFSRAPKLPGFVARVVPSNLSTKLGFARKKEKEDDVGLEQVTGSDPQQDVPSTSRDFGYSSPVGESSTAIQRSGKKEKAEDEENRLGEVVITQQPGPSSSRNTVITVVPQDHPKIGRVKVADSESSSSSSASIENIYQQAIKSTDSDDFEDNFEIRSLKSNPEEAQQQQERTQKPSPTQQQPQQQNLEEVIELPLEEGEGGEANGFALENLQPAAPSSFTAGGNENNDDHVSINLEDVGIGESAPVRNPTYLESYLEFMYTCGLSPFLPDGAKGGCWGYCQKACFIQVVIYWWFTIVAVLETSAVAKNLCLSYIQFGGLETFTNMCYSIMDSCLKIYSAYLFTLQQKQFAKMLRSIGRLRAFLKTYSKQHAENYHSWMVTLLIILSLMISTLSVLFQTGVIGWSMEQMELKYSFKISLAMYIWTPAAAAKNATDIPELRNHYGKNWTEQKALIGLIGLGIHWCNRLISNANTDLILTTAATLKKEISQLGNEVKNPDNDIEPVTLENFEAEGGQWQHYELLKDAVDDTNSTFDSMLKYVHVDNLMLFVYFIMNVFDGEFSFFAIVNFLYNIIKVAYTYRLGAKAAEMNETFRKWIRRLMRKSKDKDFIQMAFVILDQMKEEPMGLGKGQFLIDESFLFRFLGGVGSVFVLQAQSRESGGSDE